MNQEESLAQLTKDLTQAKLKCIDQGVSWQSEADEDHHWVQVVLFLQSRYDAMKRAMEAGRVVRII